MTAPVVHVCPIVSDCLGELRELRRMLREVAESGVEIDDERIDWLVVQIDRKTWRAIAAYLASEAAP